MPQDKILFQHAATEYIPERKTFLLLPRFLMLSVFFHIYFSLYLLSDSQLGAPGTGIPLHLLVGRDDHLIIDQAERRSYVPEEILLAFPLEVSGLQKVLYQTVFQGVIRDQILLLFLQFFRG